jgi:hypothetical protein
MKHYIYLLLAVLMLAACGTTKKVESTQRHVARDSVNIRDSIVIKDSLVIRYEVNVRDSVSIKDSTVLVIDQDGNVVSKEKYHSTERNRNTDKGKEVAQSQSKENVSKADERHDLEDEERKETVQKTNELRNEVMFWFSVSIFLAVIYGIIGLRKKSEK